MRKRRYGVPSAVPHAPERSRMFVAGKAAIERRPITRAEYNRIRRQGVAAARTAASCLVLALNFAAAAWVWETTREIFVFLLLPALIGAIFWAIGARRFFAISPEAAMYHFEDGSRVAVPGYQVVKQHEVWRRFPTCPTFRLVSEIPGTTNELLLTMEREGWIITNRAITEEEREELARPEPVTLMDCVVSLDFLTHFIFWAAIGWQAPAYGLIGVPLLILLLLLKSRYPAIKAVETMDITLKRDVVVDGQRVAWAEFLPDERVWSINGEPAEWRKR